MLTADRCSVGVLAPLRLAMEMDRLGRCEGEWETELLVPWLDIEVLRDRADDNSCESDSDCDNDCDSDLRPKVSD